ncbi:FAD-binding domain-containing protein [Ovoidimarina sediminis]|uniref:FAD-binding domain-containing protein n=1 Tax=Ovoidimarina sediminis TaxID=3079856 RepID=UPI002914DB1B|nr:FAD-binding domain-containing protein [Rhodophyticola sp. MJ-SS7]MDU8943041.1 FAD-binding domain-containing protein [Rhodophyticola sp. MJ-SS7]
MTRSHHPPDRSEALARLRAFVPKAGRGYAAKRNFDLEGHPHVSVLSPFIRHRMVTEEEVLAAVLGRYAPPSAEKFIQEVFWRTYWKGWLEMRPGVWEGYRAEVLRGINRVGSEAGLRRDWEAACLGQTGIGAFDHWARELRDTGYLHNHARMWFASIWIFTLRLPWALGADFFLRHLIDGDPASNTLSWRWVAGLQTRGKHYLARPSNIARYTEGRFRPEGLDTGAGPLEGPPHPERQAAPRSGGLAGGLTTGLLITEDDLSPGWLIEQVRPVASMVLSGVEGRSPLMVSERVHAFTDGAVQDMAARHGAGLGAFAGTVSGKDAAARVADWAEETGLEQIVVAHPPVGPSAERVAAAENALAAREVTLVRVIRPYDALCWPHATAGFFKFKQKIPAFLEELGLAAA